MCTRLNHRHIVQRVGGSGRGGVLPERADEHEHVEDLVAVLVDVVEPFEVTFLFLFLGSEKKETQCA